MKHSVGDTVFLSASFIKEYGWWLKQTWVTAHTEFTVADKARGQYRVRYTNKYGEETSVWLVEPHVTGERETYNIDEVI